MTAARIEQVFQALGDRTRREMVQRLSRQQPCTIDAVSRGLGITRQGARKHLQVHSLMLEGKEQVRYQIAVGRHHGGRHTKCVRR